MNGRQAAKAAAKRISELEYVVKMQSKDIRSLYAVILDMIAGKSPCSWCEENRLDECQHEDSHGNAGCHEWWLRTKDPEGGEPDAEGKTEGETEQTDGSLLDMEEQ